MKYRYEKKLVTGKIGFELVVLSYLSEVDMEFIGCTYVEYPSINLNTDKLAQKIYNKVMRKVIIKNRNYGIVENA